MANLFIYSYTLLSAFYLNLTNTSFHRKTSVTPFTANYKIEKPFLHSVLEKWLFQKLLSRIPLLRLHPTILLKHKRRCFSTISNNFS